MVARLLFSGMALGFLASAYLGFVSFSAAEAANPYAAIENSSPVRAVFRPGPATGYGARAPAAAQRLSASSARQWSGNAERRNGQDGVFADGRTGARKAVPVTRGQELGLRFRPDENELPYGQSGSPQAGTAPNVGSEELQSQFRPTQKKRKPTYEELYAEPAMPQQPPLPAPILPYPMLPPPLPGYGRGWPGW